ncbi:hypothetical protein [Photorhabdus sp. CRCIA-P01]|uniref:hypothetical protein n=1 Tax=Photorhabdus sp. CRCIA-P01 TaxID=2019570 RepID=UPI000E59A454|nr:hypothetical protein [Photorhabdus sp. CRCIA-P01]
MTIHGKKINVQLIKNSPDQLSVSDLKAQLTAIGLTCELTDERLLEQYIEDVRKQMITGSTQAFTIGEYNNGNLVHTSNANWSPEEGALGYKEQLIYIGAWENFQWLRENCKAEFGGDEDNPPSTQERYDDVDAVKKAFIKVAEGASETLVNPLDKKDMESALTNLLSSVNNDNVKNYDSGHRTKLFLLIENYDPERNMGDGIGVLGIDWRLRISDYKKKKQNVKHDTIIDLKSWSVTYDNTDTLISDYHKVKNASS